MSRRVRQPPYSIEGTLAAACAAEAADLADTAARGDLVGLVWIAITARKEIVSGTAGTLARNSHLAAGVLLDGATAVVKK